MQKVRISNETIAAIEKTRIEGESFDSALKRVLGITATKAQLYVDYPSSVVDHFEALLGEVRQEFDLTEIIEEREAGRCINLVTPSTQTVILQARIETASESIELFVREDRQGGLLAVGSISDGCSDERVSLIRHRLRDEVRRAKEQWAPTG